MDRNERLDRSGRGHGRATMRMGIGLLVLAGLLGCTDHRISLAEFLEMQQVKHADIPTTQPAIDETAQAEALTLINRALGPYVVGPGDVLRVTLSGLEEGPPMPSVDARVSRTGTIDLPGVGALEVMNLELEDVEARVHEAYVPRLYREAAVHVTLVEFDTTDVLVVGAVLEPGLVRLRRTQRNLLHAIVTAGGVSDVASGAVKLRRLRGPETETTLTLTDPDGLRAALALDPLESGDILNVQSAVPNTVFVGGLVNAPRPQTYPQGVDMTVLQALAASGGLRTDVTPREATLIRRMPDGEDVHVKLDLDRITTGQDPNIMLAAGDVLWVPETLETRIHDWINQNVFFRVGAVSTANLNYNITGIDFLNSNARNQALRGFGQRGGVLQDQFDPFGFLLTPRAPVPAGP